MQLEVSLLSHCLLIWLLLIKHLLSANILKDKFRHKTDKIPGAKILKSNSNN